MEISEELSFLENYIFVSYGNLIVKFPNLKLRLKVSMH